MRRIIIILLLVSISFSVASQVTEGTMRCDGINAGQAPMPYPFLRESDVLWSTCLWKTIDLHESFNQFMYFPTDTFHVEGRVNLATLLWDAVAAGEIPIFEDDELKIPIDNELFVMQYTKADTIQLEIGYDEEDNELYETIIRPHYFEPSEVYSYALREVWFIGKQDTRQDSRRIALAPLKHEVVERGNGAFTIDKGIVPIFWIPMQNPAVRTFLARHTAFIDGSNNALQPSWDYIFVSQRYSAYVTRESNRYLREVTKYLTGIDAILESEAIEEKVFEIGDDMWEY
ncbi:MAG: gliding motility protein GldN [Bacteroidales bacterium]|nr:gliding motility protein GldN [Bacteroidales bacterium]